MRQSSLRTTKATTLPQVTIEKSSNSAPVLSTKSDIAAEGKDEPAHPVQDAITDPSLISAFVSQVSDLIK